MKSPGPGRTANYSTPHVARTGVHEQGTLKATCRDTDIEQTDDDLKKKSEERYRLLVENAHEAILVIRGLIKFVNPGRQNYESGGVAPKPPPFWILFTRGPKWCSAMRNDSAGCPARRCILSVSRSGGGPLGGDQRRPDFLGEASRAGLPDGRDRKQLSYQFLQAQKMKPSGAGRGVA
jgi:hypothetical protein